MWDNLCLQLVSLSILLKSFTGYLQIALLWKDCIQCLMENRELSKPKHTSRFCGPHFYAFLHIYIHPNKKGIMGPSRQLVRSSVSMFVLFNHLTDLSQLRRNFGEINFGFLSTSTRVLIFIATCSQSGYKTGSASIPAFAFYFSPSLFLVSENVDLLTILQFLLGNPTR